METLSDAVVSICPAAFTGNSGLLFANAVTAVVAAHCTILNGHQWPKDNSEEILQNVRDGLRYDFVIVGAGTAGSIVASGLSTRFPTQSVLLIEAGEDPGLDSEVPALLFQNQNANVDWNYKTHPDGRSCLGFTNNSCVWSKGRAMGGSSSINAMLYIRGHPNDYDEWKENGATGWGYEDLKPYFKKIENKIRLDDCTTEDNEWYEVIKSAWNESGYIYNDKNDEAQIGIRKTKLLTRDGKRLNTAKMYLKESRNLHIMKNTHVNKVIIDGLLMTAKGVEISHANGIEASISINKEVILSAGSIATPQILIKSGIGLMSHLEEIGIQCLANLSVGQHLQDHILLPIFLSTSLHTIISPQELVNGLLQYMTSRTGPFANIGITDFMGFINIDDSKPYPDVQFHHTYFFMNDSFMLVPYLKGVGYRDEIIKSIVELNKESDMLGIYPTLIHPKSRGEVILSNYKNEPIIKPNYFQERDDLVTLIRAVDFIRKLTDTASFKSLGVKLAEVDLPGCSNDYLGTENYWECYVKQMATTIYHPVGTAKIGKRSDLGVVDENLLVHEFFNLRVVDASVMPTIPSSNTMAPTMAIAEKAVDIIVKHHQLTDRSEL